MVRGAWRATQSMELQRVGHDLETKHVHAQVLVCIVLLSLLNKSVR